MPWRSFLCHEIRAFTRQPDQKIEKDQRLGNPTTRASFLVKLKWQNSQVFANEGHTAAFPLRKNPLPTRIFNSTFNSLRPSSASGKGRSGGFPPHRRHRETF